jgi:hypothetical protein
MAEPVSVLDEDSGRGIDEVLEIEKLWRWVEKNPRFTALLAVVTFGGPILGGFLVGPIGVLVGLALAGLSWWLGPEARREHERKEITRR